MGLQKVAVSTVLAIAMVLLVGCGSGKGVKKGDRFEVLEPLREQATTQWEEPYSDGFVCHVPAGTILEATYSSTPGAKVFECKPIKVPGMEDPEATRSMVPQAIREKEGYLGFSLSLSIDLIGAKLRKLEQ